ncbi:hypothetical protein C8J57DRAFT_1532500 [Mycena rebaudengoi]|nr:hypothetical protein C8J57DRAFT_1532500 [Mycena rebaudengoi]
MNGPSVQVTVHHTGANNSGDDRYQDLSWDEISKGDYEALFGFVAGVGSEKDAWLYPTNTMFEDFSTHYHREWNPFCDTTFKRLRKEMEDGRARLRSRRDWREYFQSSNRGRNTPKVVVDAAFIKEGLDRINHVFDGPSWNGLRIKDIHLPEAFKHDF